MAHRAPRLYLRLPTPTPVGVPTSVPADLAARLLQWYENHGRELPWRQSRDPYAIWVAEVMLQQTRVETVIPYYQRWMAEFPTVGALAAADQQTVLALWEGLGYYQRARNLHRAAGRVVSEFDGTLPQRQEDLRTLPGVGAYTSAAIAAIAFGEDTIALDGNLRRVLSRLDNVELEIRSPQAERTLRQRAQELLPSGRAGAFNQALMDLGATLCTPQSPDCGRCPIQDHCQAYTLGLVEERPVRRPRGERPRVFRAIAIIERDGEVLLGRRLPDRLLGGMWEFPGFDFKDPHHLASKLVKAVQQNLGLDCQDCSSLETIDHGYTHYRVTAHPFRCRWVAGTPNSDDHTELRWVRPTALPEHPMGRIDRSLSDVLIGG